MMCAADDLCAEIERDFGQRLVPRLTRRRLQSTSRPLHGDPASDESQAQGQGPGLAMCKPLVSVPTDAVMHVHGDHFVQACAALSRKPGHDLQQCRGVATAAVADDRSDRRTARRTPPQRLVAAAIDGLEPRLRASQRRAGRVHQQFVARIRFLRSCS